MIVVKEYLSALPQSNDEDLVLLVDAWDVWFQLPIEVLLQRYDAINLRANERIRNQIGAKRVREYGVAQTIVASTQKRCWPADSADHVCYAVPQSPLPSDLYGDDTDQHITTPEDDSFEYARYRPRYINSGIIMGNVKDMRKLYEELLNIYDDNPDETSDQAILARAFGDQEYQRHVWADEHRPKISLRDVKYTHPHPMRRRPHLKKRSYQYSLGLDYWSELGVSTIFSDHDYDWIRFNDTESIRQAWESHNVTNPQSQTLDKDIANARPPFTSRKLLTANSKAVLQEVGETAIATASNTWNEQPLFSNLWTGVTPAVIHHNAYRADLKKIREYRWPDLWLQAHARDLLKQRLDEGEQSYDSPVHEVAKIPWGVYTDREGEEQLTWNNVCNAGMQKEVFRDDKGAFEYP